MAGSPGRRSGMCGWWRPGSPGRSFPPSSGPRRHHPRPSSDFSASRRRVRSCERSARCALALTTRFSFDEGAELHVRAAQRGDLRVAPGVTPRPPAPFRSAPHHQEIPARAGVRRMAVQGSEPATLGLKFWPGRARACQRPGLSSLRSRTTTAFRGERPTCHATAPGLVGQPWRVVAAGTPAGSRARAARHLGHGRPGGDGGAQRGPPRGLRRAGWSPWPSAPSGARRCAEVRGRVGRVGSSTTTRTRSRR